MNKTQLKIKIKIDFFNWVGPGSMHLALDQTRSGRKSGYYSFLGFFKRATTLGKISSGTKLGLRLNSVNATLSSDFLLFFFE